MVTVHGIGGSITGYERRPSLRSAIDAADSDCPLLAGHAHCEHVRMGLAPRL
jgi:hypothetical protein